MRKTTKTSRAVVFVITAASVAVIAYLGARQWIDGSKVEEERANVNEKNTEHLPVEISRSSVAGKRPSLPSMTNTTQPKLPADPLSAPPVWSPRDPEEWQGMLVNTNIRQVCDVSKTCGLALACINGECGPCKADSDCSAGEACVLDHCVAAANTTCRTRHDCGGEELCVLTGYSHDPRGNSIMKAKCMATFGENTEARELEVAEEDPSTASPRIDAPIETEWLLDSAREHLELSRQNAEVE